MIEPADRAAIVARATSLLQFESGPREKAKAFSCSRPLDGTATIRRSALSACAGAMSRHRSCGLSRKAIDRNGGADGGNIRRCAQRFQQTVVAPAAKRGALSGAPATRASNMKPE